VEHHARIFDQFHQVDNSNTKAKGGAGLGQGPLLGIATAGLGQRANTRFDVLWGRGSDELVIKNGEGPRRFALNRWQTRPFAARFRRAFT